MTPGSPLTLLPLSPLSPPLSQLKIPRDARIPGTELTRDVYRWDQRLFSLVLRLTGTPPHERDGTGLVDSDSSGIGKLCDATGGEAEPAGSLSDPGTILPKCGRAAKTAAIFFSFRE